MPDAQSRISLAVIPLELLVLVGDEHRDPARLNSIAVEIRTFQCAPKVAGNKDRSTRWSIGAAVEVTGGWNRRGWAVCRTEVLSIMQEVPVTRRCYPLHLAQNTVRHGSCSNDDN
jgi:hypothetical protein